MNILNIKHSRKAIESHNRNIPDNEGVFYRTPSVMVKELQRIQGISEEYVLSPGVNNCPNHSNTGKMEKILTGNVAKRAHDSLKKIAKRDIGKLELDGNKSFGYYRRATRNEEWICFDNRQGKLEQASFDYERAAIAWLRMGNDAIVIPAQKLRGTEIKMQELATWLVSKFKRYRITDLRYFGSRVYGKPTEKSDIDVYVLFDKKSPNRGPIFSEIYSHEGKNYVVEIHGFMDMHDDYVPVHLITDKATGNQIFTLKNSKVV